MFVFPALQSIAVYQHDIRNEQIIVIVPQKYTASSVASLKKIYKTVGYAHAPLLSYLKT